MISPWMFTRAVPGLAQVALVVALRRLGSETRLSSEVLPSAGESPHGFASKGNLRLFRECTHGGRRPPTSEPRSLATASQGLHARKAANLPASEPRSSAQREYTGKTTKSRDGVKGELDE